jgi:uncharacterized short protein YbdD (DUF466 family)
MSVPEIGNPAGKLDIAVKEVNETLMFFQKSVLAPLSKLVREMEALPMIGVDDYEEFLKREATYDPSSFENTIKQQETLMALIEQNAQKFVQQLSVLEQAEKAEGETPASQGIVRKALKMQEAIQSQVKRMHELGQEVMEKSIRFMQAELVKGDKLTNQDEQMVEELSKALKDLSSLITNQGKGE